MKSFFLLLLVLYLPAGTFAQAEEPDPFERVVAGMKGTDTFMVYGDLCLGCVVSTRERIELVFKKKGVVWLKSWKYEGRFENVYRTRKRPYG